jgi:hypothetical protein
VGNFMRSYAGLGKLRRPAVEVLLGLATAR